MVKVTRKRIPATRPPSVVDDDERTAPIILEKYMKTCDGRLEGICQDIEILLAHIIKINLWIKSQFGVELISKGTAGRGGILDAADQEQQQEEELPLNSLEQQQLVDQNQEHHPDLDQVKGDLIEASPSPRPLPLPSSSFPFQIKECKVVLVDISCPTTKIESDKPVPGLGRPPAVPPRCTSTKASFKAQEAKSVIKTQFLQKRKKSIIKKNKITPKIRPRPSPTSAGTISNNNYLACHFCNRIFIRRSNLVEHIRTHTGEKPFSCPICARSFPQAGTLTTHMRIHTGEKPFQCTICLEKFTRNNQLSRHSEIHMRTIQSKLSEEGRTGRTHDHLHLSAEREKQQQDRLSVQPDIQARQRGAENGGPLSDNGGIEILGDMVFIEADEGAQSECIGQEEEEQEECEIILSDYSGAGSSFLTLTGQQNSRTSELCQSPSMSSVESQPNNINVVQAQSRLPQSHQQRGKRAPCPYCSQSFSRSNIQRHIRSHTGEKPYKCHICHRQYSQRHWLTDHLRMHTSNEGKPPPFQCTLCSWAFASRRSLDIHLYKHRRRQLVQCTSPESTSENQIGDQDPYVATEFGSAPQAMTNATTVNVNNCVQMSTETSTSHSHGEHSSGGNNGLEVHSWEQYMEKNVDFVDRGGSGGAGVEQVEEQSFQQQQQFKNELDEEDGNDLAILPD